MPVLKYLFKAKFGDDSEYYQTPDDKSELDPKKSQFFDVLEICKTKKLIEFSLMGWNIEPYIPVISVNLQTGLFNISGVEVLLESQKLPTLPDKFELIFYRQWTQNLTVTYKVKTGEPQSSEQNGEGFCEYFIGWKCEIAGKEYTQKLAVA